MDQIDQGEISEDRPTLRLQEGSYSLPELLDSHLLPVVAQLDTTRQPAQFNEFNFDLTQPLLLYKKRNIQKVASRSLTIQDEKYEEVGESLLIPEDYKGWFAVLQRVTGNTRADDTVPHFTSVDELACSNTERFLIGGTKKINGLQLNDRTGVQLKHEQRSFLPGDTLTIEKVYFGETRKRTRLFRKPKYITEKFLMCRDEADREILLPFEQSGIFYQISHRSGKATKNVLQMSDIVARKLTPRIIKLVYGRFPVTPCAFTGLMRADSSKIETSIIASTIINTKNILLEIPVTSAMYFRVAMMDPSLRQNTCYKSAIGLCAEKAMTYMRNIKVCYNFTSEDDTESYFHAPLIQQQSLPLRENFDSEETPPQTRRHNQVMKTFSDNKYNASKRHTSFQESDEPVIRPGRCTSTGRMSFCLGNSYLTVPVFEPGMNMNRNSGNNNTFQEAVYKTRRGSKISFNGKFFEEEGVPEEASPELSSAVPPPLASTNIGSYLNIMIPPKITVNTDDDYISTTGQRRPSTQPPTVSPPPPPESTSTSGVSSGSTSSVSDGTVSNRGSTESFEYAVPKIDETQTVLGHLRERSKSANETSPPVVDTSANKPRVRRPSTFTFSDGCFLTSPTVSKAPTVGAIQDSQETKSEESSPIYENIKSLLELVTELETHKEDMEEEEDADANDAGISGKNASLTNGNSTQDMLQTLKEYMKEEDEDNGDKSENDNDDDTEDGADKDITLDYPTSEQANSDNDDDINDGITRNPEVVEENANEKDNVEISNCSNNEHEDQTDNLEPETTNINSNSDTDCNDPEKSPEITVRNGYKYSFESNVQNDYPVSKRRNSFTETIEATTTEYEEHLKRNRSRTLGSLDSEIDETSNVKPSDICNRWRVAVRRLMNESEDGVKTVNAALRYNTEPSVKTLDMYSTEDIAKQLRSIGIKDSVVNHLETLNVDGVMFQKVLDGELSIRDCLNGVNLIDQQKISMFIRGWRPSVE